MGGAVDGHIARIAGGKHSPVWRSRPRSAAADQDQKARKAKQRDPGAPEEPTPTRRRLDEKVSAFPIDERTFVAGDGLADAPDAAYVAALDGPHKGLLVVERLLFDAAGDAAVLARLASTRQRAFLSALCVDVAAVAAQVQARWSSSAQGYAATWAAQSRLVRETLLLDRLYVVISVLKDVRVAAPGGLTSPNHAPAPWLSEGDRAGHAKEEILASLDAVEEVFTGAGLGRGLADALDELAPGVWDRTRDTLTATARVIAAIPRTIAEATSSESFDSFYSFRSLQTLLSVEIAPALDTQLSFTLPGRD